MADAVIRSSRRMNLNTPKQSLARRETHKFSAGEDFWSSLHRLGAQSAVVGVALLGVLAICAPAVSGHIRPTDVTYLKDVRPILEKRCIGCHATGGFAGVPLDSYAGARQWAKQIREQVLERTMPPWPAAPGFGDFRNDRSLSAIEVELLSAWSDGGTPVGTGGTTEIKPVLPDQRTITVTLPDGDPGGGSRGRLSLPVDVGSDRWIAGWEYRPGNAEVEQFAEFFVENVRIGSWLPGQGAVLYPRGVTVAAPRRAHFTGTIGYRKSETRDRRGGRLTLRFGARAGVEPTGLPLRCGENRIRRSVHVLSITPYAPADGDSIEIVARDVAGRVDPLSVIPRYRTNYPFTYEFRRPVALARGSVIEVRSSAPGCAARLDVIPAAPADVASRGR